MAKNSKSVVLPVGFIKKLSPEVSEKMAHSAAEMGQPKVLKQLVPHLKNFDKLGPALMTIAAKHGQLEVIKTLVQSGVNPRAHDVTGFSPMVAAMVGSGKKVSETMGLIFALGADLNGFSPSGRYSTLEYASLYAQSTGHTEGIRTLIAYGANPFARDRNGVEVRSYHQPGSEAYVHIDFGQIIAKKFIQRTMRNTGGKSEWARKSGYLSKLNDFSEKKRDELREQHGLPPREPDKAKRLYGAMMGYWPR